MITLIIPTYKCTEHLDLCLRSATEGKTLDNTQIIVVVDNDIKPFEEVLKKYKVDVLPLGSNLGMQRAINMGVYNALNPTILLANDDNVFPTGWDAEAIANFKGDKHCMTIQQIEPDPSIYSFIHMDLGRTPLNFDLDKFNEVVKQTSKAQEVPDGGIFPVVLTKKDFMIVGGFDEMYPSPSVCDWDFFLKLELNGVKFYKTLSTSLYHFGGASTYNGDRPVEFREGQQEASKVYKYKWGTDPSLYENNSHLPKGQTIKGISF